MPKYFRFPWAVAGDKTAIPDETQTNGSVSYQEGYGDPYEQDPETAPGARNIEREMYNQALFDITETLQQYYQRGVPPYITADDNGGTPFGYSQYSRVFFNNRIYESLINNNTNQPTVTTAWRLVDFTALDSLYLLSGNNLSDLTSTETAITNLGLGTAAPLDFGTSPGNVPRIGTPGTTELGSDSAVIVRAGSNANGHYILYSNGLIHQWNSNLPNGRQDITFPIQYTEESTISIYYLRNTSSSAASENNGTFTSVTTTGFNGHVHNEGSANWYSMVIKINILTKIYLINNRFFNQ